MVTTWLLPGTQAVLSRLANSMSDYVYNLYMIIPIGGRNLAGQIADLIMPDVDEDKMFDSIRLSTSGNEPATHLATDCPLTPRMAKRWKNLFLAAEADPQDFPDVSDTLTAGQLSAIASAIANARFIAVITNRLSGDNRTLIRRNRTVRVIDSVKYPNITQIPDLQAILDRVGLVRIRSEAE